MKILVLDDGYKGNFNQSFGISKEFPDSRLEISSVTLKGPQYRLFGRKGKSPLSVKLLALLSFFGAWALAKKCLGLLWNEYYKIKEEEFDIIISAGSILAPVNLILTKSQKRAKSVNIMTPSMIRLKLFDFLVIPYHDYLKLRKKKLKNLIVTLGAPNCLTDELLLNEKKKLIDILKVDTSKKNIGVLLGGDDQNYKISIPFVREVTSLLFEKKSKYNFIFTTSRRTNGEVVHYLKKRLVEEPSVIYSEFPGYSGNSLYPGVVSLCEYILVTEDSVNMVSEASSLGVPVVILGVERKNKKKLIFDFTIEKLKEKGYAEYISKENLNTFWDKIESFKKDSRKKLRESEKCAQEILKNII